MNKLEASLRIPRTLEEGSHSSDLWWQKQSLQAFWVSLIPWLRSCNKRVNASALEIWDPYVNNVYPVFCMIRYVSV